MLIAELVKEKDLAEAKRLAELEAARVSEGETIQEKLTREKEERKRAALERSKQRQEQNPAYFAARQQANEKASKEKDMKNGALVTAGKDVDSMTEASPDPFTSETYTATASSTPAINAPHQPPPPSPLTSKKGASTGAEPGSPV